VPNLTLSTGQSQQQYETERGHILILGGDQVYPYPTREEYDKRFRMPFEEAAKKKLVKSIRILLLIFMPFQGIMIGMMDSAIF
jgi:hypothetical protein